jgi:prepilin-type N-terminal cleavage/methylation domain-containing protein
MKKINLRGFTLIEVMLAIAVFVIFAVGVYGGVQYMFKIIYLSRVHILETAILSERLEIIRNLPYQDVGLIGGIPNGILERNNKITRNGIDFDIITTIRNIDDPFDGTVTTTPQDTSPADYKLVELSIICSDCSQKKPFVLSTIIAPKNREGDTLNGSLFIQVFDANGRAISGATVRVINVSTTPAIDITDTTGDDGWLRIVDTPTSTLGYQIYISKDGYSSDYTTSSSALVLNPVKLPANVASQQATEIYFAIDLLSTLSASTINPSCAILPSRTLNIWSKKLIGTEPATSKFFDVFQTNESGYYLYDNSLEWGDYYFSASGTAYDIAGTIPILPLYLNPGLSQEIKIILRPKTDHSLLIGVKDSGTLLPLSDASVRLFGNGYDQTLVTGLGYARQTNWSLGSGQEYFEDEDRYFSDDGGIDNNSSPGDLRLSLIGSEYISSGWLESSTFDMGGSVNFNNIIWAPLNQSPPTGDNPVKFQIATSNSSTPESWDFVGPDGTDSTYYTATSTLIYSGHSGQRYLRYRVYLSTDNTEYSPQLFEIAFTYTNSCTPPGQSFFNGLSSSTYFYSIDRAGYLSTTGTVDVNGAADIQLLLPVD